MTILASPPAADPCPLDLAERLLHDAPADGADGPSGPALAAALRASGLLTRSATLAHHPRDPLQLLDALRRVGRANLSAGRIFEGHVNAVKLLHLHGGPLDAVRQGLLHGIWGADGPDPARIDGGVLRGQKLFASGADVLDRMIVTVGSPQGLQLLLLSRDQLQGRLYPEEWQMSGMRATGSGRCDLDGVALADTIPLGPPDGYLREPHFHGGVWRYAAVQLGAMQALTALTADQLTARDQQAAPLQAMRLHRMILSCETARLWLAQAACRIEDPRATPADAEVAILARLRTADEAVSLMADMDQALGAASFATAHPADRIRRDLSLYLRQAGPDALALASVARILDDAGLRARWIG
ncbi:acyl-CoA dehydrogenase family protein [Paracoccus nototheniae]|uniref:acyl-CoA dehydrogenase family protein n=1 Tax=Paracoccus nototheniae TaxID=2489002 RepID=UPI00103AC6CC|nr:acyl-CoA dehydrogenase family protein [Paracoccus nototheniae]